MTLPRPSLAPAPPWDFPEAERQTLSNGIEVLRYHRPGQYVVSATLLMPVPLSVEPRDREGVAALTAATLDQGTTLHPGTAFADAVESTGAVLDAGVGYAHAEVSLDVPGTHLGEVAPLFADLLQSPELADADVERQRILRLSTLAQQQARGADRAQVALRHALLDPGCRQQRLPGGEAETVANVTGDDVRRHHQRWFGPRGSTLVLAGDASDEAVLALLDACASWENPHQETSGYEAAAPAAPTAVIVDRPGSVQADLRWGWFTLDRSDRSWAALQVGTHAVGGGVLSRVNKVLREERGYTYGAHLSNAPLRVGGMSYVHGSFRTEVVGPTLDLLPGLIDLSASPLTDDEVARARDFLIGVTPLRYATAAGLCDGVTTLLAAGQTPAFIPRQLRRWHDVTAHEATEATAAQIRPDGGTLILVGDAEALEPQVEAAGWNATVITGDSPT